MTLLDRGDYMIAVISYYFKKNCPVIDIGKHWNLLDTFKYDKIVWNKMQKANYCKGLSALQLTAIVWK